MSPAPLPAGEPSGNRLLDYWQILVRRRWVLIATVAALMAGVAIKTFRTTPTYRAVATLQIERVDPNILKFQDVVTYDPSYLSYQDYYQTQYKLIESHAVAERTVHRFETTPRAPDR